MEENISPIFRVRYEEQVFSLAVHKDQYTWTSVGSIFDYLNVGDAHLASEETPLTGIFNELGERIKSTKTSG